MTDEHEWRANCAVASASTTISRPGGCNPRTSAAMAHHGHACNCETGLNPEPLQRLLRVEASGGYKRRWNYVSEIQRHGMDASWRQKMCRWMFETGQAFDLMADTVASAIHCMDQYLSVLSVDKIMLQLVSMVCMYTASKMHESYPISMEELELLCEHKFSRANIRLMEAQLLQVLDWKLNPPVPHIFARDFIQLLRLPSIDHQRLLQENVLDFLQLVLEDYASLRFKSSSLAIAAVQLFYQLQYPQAEPGAMLAVLSHLDVNATELIESFRLLRDIYRAEVAVHIQRQP
ncbi:TPA: hypothetical protein N0F65_001638 [Lagenidium giganteum]|uniref:Cyclin-like domain-containing protein n=1 Tax=Lagenidium giganteum TaxID=4803 RepID=A0AAV2YAW3_9STRA|nr:TPA: hypothetical protein N0F65_001638 [Lagenidium giganteum]